MKILRAGMDPFAMSQWQWRDPDAPAQEPTGPTRVTHVITWAHTAQSQTETVIEAQDDSLYDTDDPLMKRVMQACRPR